ncbi:MAG: diguanylate cyclase [Holophaga sp.]|nr:diguanylate cyclase [Holophaga sp.]
MNLLAITQHAMLLERLRTAFEGAGHAVTVVPDHLHALATEAWNGAHLLLVDAEGDPLDGYRLCHLLRAESRSLFRNLPIFLILEHPPGEADQARLMAADGDGFLEADASIQTLLTLLGPLLGGAMLRGQHAQAALVALGLPAWQVERIREVVQHLGFELQVGSRKNLPQTLQAWHPPILFMGLGHSLEQAQTTLQSLPPLPRGPYPILVGGLPSEAGQRRLLTAGAMDWLTLPLSGPMMLHACRKAVEWIHIKRIQMEYQHQLQDLVEQRKVLELETNALRNEVLTDALTELLNRRAFDQHLEHAVNQWERHHRSFVLILGDLDYFKLINDRFGHLVGDQVLRSVAQRISSSLRRSDLAFRIGGEEFAIILIESGLNAGAEVAEKIRRRIDESPVTLESGQNVFPTMSFGVGAPDGAGGLALFARVDQSLYVAKRKGRNRIEVLPPVDSILE